MEENFIMKKVEFLPALISTNAMVDAQHKELIEAINKLYAAIDEGKGVEEAKKTLEFLAQYTIFHFGGEEALMQAQQYPLYTEHKKAHDAFVVTVKGLFQVLTEKGATEEFGALVEKEVTNWLINHIQGMDIRMTDWIKIKSNGMMDNML